MTTIHLASASGGVGTTTIACVMACTLARDAGNTLIVDTSRFGDVSSVLGLPRNLNGVIEATQNLWVSDRYEMFDHYEEGYENVIIDYGTRINLSVFPNVQKGDKFYYVVKNCYVSLKNTITLRDNVVRIGDVGYVGVFDKSRVLTEQDVMSVVGKEVTWLEQDERVARSVDAGLLATRFQNFGEAVSNLALQKI